MSTDISLDISRDHMYSLLMFRESDLKLMSMNNSPNSLSQDVYTKLLERFLNNEIVPGTVLDRKELAVELGVSAAPLHEALKQLTLEGFIETLPRKGTIAKAINRKDVYGSLIIREAIEVQAARMYCGTPIIENRKELERIAEIVDSDELKLGDHWKWDINFHICLIRLSECDALVSEYQRIMKIGTFYQMNTFLLNDDKEERLCHMNLIEDLTTEDPEKAERVIREHLKSGKRNFF